MEREKENKNDNRNKLTLLFPSPLSEDSTRDEIFKCMEMFDSNKDKAWELGRYNEKVYSSFIDNNRKLIKSLMPVKGKVYKVINNESSKSYRYSEIDLDRCKYVYILKWRLTKDSVGKSDFIPQVKVLPLDENGKIFENLSEYALEDGREIKINNISEENEPSIEVLVRKELKSLKNNEEATYRRLQKKFG